MKRHLLLLGALIVSALIVVGCGSGIDVTNPDGDNPPAELAKLQALSSPVSDALVTILEFEGGHLVVADSLRTPDERVLSDGGYIVTCSADGFIPQLRDDISLLEGQERLLQFHLEEMSEPVQAPTARLELLNDVITRGEPLKIVATSTNSQYGVVGPGPYLTLGDTLTVYPEATTTYTYAVWGVNGDWVRADPVTVTVLEPDVLTQLSITGECPAEGDVWRLVNGQWVYQFDFVAPGIYEVADEQAVYLARSWDTSCGYVVSGVVEVNPGEISVIHLNNPSPATIESFAPDPTWLPVGGGQVTVSGTVWDYAYLEVWAEGQIVFGASAGDDAYFESDPFEVTRTTRVTLKAFGHDGIARYSHCDVTVAVPENHMGLRVESWPMLGVSVEAYRWDEQCNCFVRDPDYDGTTPYQIVGADPLPGFYKFVGQDQEGYFLAYPGYTQVEAGREALATLLYIPEGEDAPDPPEAPTIELSLSTHNADMSEQVGFDVTVTNAGFGSQVIVSGQFFDSAVENGSWSDEFTAVHSGPAYATAFGPGGVAQAQVPFTVNTPPPGENWFWEHFGCGDGGEKCACRVTLDSPVYEFSELLVLEGEAEVFPFLLNEYSGDPWGQKFESYRWGYYREGESVDQAIWCERSAPSTISWVPDPRGFVGQLQQWGGRVVLPAGSWVRVMAHADMFPAIPKPNDYDPSGPQSVATLEGDELVHYLE